MEPTYADERDERDARGFALARGHAFVQSIATEDVCGDCGAHRDYHEDQILESVERVQAMIANVRESLRNL